MFNNLGKLKKKDKKKIKKNFFLKKIGGISAPYLIDFLK